MEKQYITILIESLQKKSAILSELIGNSKNQAALLKEDMVDWEHLTGARMQNPI